MTRGFLESPHRKWSLNVYEGDVLGGPVVENPPSHAADIASIPGRELTCQMPRAAKPKPQLPPLRSRAAAPLEGTPRAPERRPSAAKMKIIIIIKT